MDKTTPEERLKTLELLIDDIHTELARSPLQRQRYQPLSYKLIEAKSQIEAFRVNVLWPASLRPEQGEEYIPRYIIGDDGIMEPFEQGAVCYWRDVQKALSAARSAGAEEERGKDYEKALMWWRRGLSDEGNSDLADSDEEEWFKKMYPSQFPEEK